MFDEIEVESITFKACDEPLYDIEVAEDHTFIASSDGQGYALTHNSGFPDIDTDVGNRDKLIEAAREYFGEESVVPVSNFNTLKLKSLVKDVSKFYGIPFDEVNAVTGPLEREVEMKARDPNMEKSMFILKHEDCMEHSEAYKDFMTKYPQVESQVRALFMMNRSVGRHAGGVLICPDLEKHMPLITVRGELQTPWTEGVNIRNLEENGFLKFDFLGLKQMQMVEDCIRRILRRELGYEPTFAEIKDFYDKKLNCRYVEPDDINVFKNVYQQGKWPGIFQFTSDGARKFCIAAETENIIDLSTVTAIYRPGPLKANVHKKYVDLKKRKDTLKYDHPVIEEILGPTVGCLHGCTVITTDDGDFTIKEIVENQMIGVGLPSLNEKTHEIEKDVIVAAIHTGFKETIEIEVEDGRTLRLTPDHRIYTTRGWVEAGELTLEDEILGIES